MTAARPAEALSFERIEVRRFPGFERGGFELRDLSPGINLIHGPQATGKSTVGRVVERLLWPDPGPWTDRSLAAVVHLDRERWQIEAEHAPPRFRREGTAAAGLPVPGGELADRYSLALHELLQAETDEASFARVVARELAGGFDLEDAGKEIGAKERTGRPHNLVQEYEDAWRAEERARDELRELAREEASLDRLREEERAARDAARELAEIGRVVAWRGHRERAAAEDRLLRDHFAEAMERITGDELETLAALDAELADAEADVEAVRAGIRQAKRALAEASLPEGGVPRAVLKTLRERHARLQKVEAGRAEAERDLRAFRSRREDARRRLGDLVRESEAAGGAPGSLPADAWRPVVELARKAERLRARAAHLREVEEWLGDSEPPEELPRLGEAVGRLRRWLRAGSGAGRLAVPGILAAAALGGLAVLGALEGEPRLWAVVGAAVVLALWIAGSALLARRDRSSAAREYGGLGFELPDRWRPAAVSALLRRLEERLAEARLEAKKSERWSGVQSRKGRLEEERRALQRERERLLKEVGIAPEVGAELDDAPLALLVEGLAAWREAEAEVGAREALLEGSGVERDEILGAVATELRPYGYPPPEDADALDGVLDELERREEARHRAWEELTRLTGEREGGAGNGEAPEVEGRLERAERQAARLRADRETLFRDRGLEPGDRAGLARLLELRPDYRDQVERARKARWALERAEAELPDRADLLELSSAALEERRAHLERSAGREKELSNRIAVIESEVRKAKESHDLEEAGARLEEARWALRQERDRDADGEVAHELGRWLGEQVSGRRRPALMERAGALFARITRGRYRLLDPVGNPPTLFARETLSDRDRSLGELSSGVRVQLLLSVRVAFIEGQERGVRLPLVMDETLANSDDRSSREIVEAVLELAGEGRQVFYMTAQEDEVAKWRAALEEAAGDGPDWKVIDLEEVRGLAEAEATPRSGWRPRDAGVPAPEGRSRREYAELLGVPGIDPRAPVGRAHLWHLVDEPEVLHRLLEEGFQRWGQLEALADDDRVVKLLGSGEEGQRRWCRLQARGRCLEVLCEAWRRGRGRPVDRGVLVASGAVSEAFIDEASALAEELGGFAAALLEALKERRVKGFYTSKTNELEEYLAAEGYLDDREPLDDPDLREVALRELSVELERGELTLPEVDRLLAALVMG